jgi:hypothetical protein
MLNSKETLKKLHKKFPQLSLDDLFDILDCYVEEYNFFNKPSYWSNDDFKPNKPLTSIVYDRINTDADFDFTQFTTSH